MSMLQSFSYKTNSLKQIYTFSLSIHLVCSAQPFCSSAMSSKTQSVRVSDDTLIEKSKTLATPLSGKHKGQAGRIGVFGGSIEFTGAPYYSAISALKVGADLSYVFTIKDAAFVIKSYSPELMVLPFLDDPDSVIDKVTPWIYRLHVVLLGPGMGRLTSTQQIFEKIIGLCRSKNKPLVIDADGLFFVAENPDVIKDYPAPVVLTPNDMELARIVGKHSGVKQFLERVGPNTTIFHKGLKDEIITVDNTIEISGGGSDRRCGGQGDMLAGALSTFLAWALERKWAPAVACYAASKLTRDCNARAFSQYGRSMLVTDMIQEIPDIFQENFELPEFKRTCPK